MSSHLPQLRMSYWNTVEGDHYLKDDARILKMVVSQGIPVHLELRLPGFYSVPEVCFPQPFEVRVYSAAPYPRNEVASYRNSYTSYSKMLPRVKYKFGLQEVPWMFDGYLPRQMFKRERDVVVNYVIENGSSGFSGVVIQVNRREVRTEERMRIFRFSTGNESGFFERWKTDPNTILLAEFAPVEPETRHLHWMPVQPVSR